MKAVFIGSNTLTVKTAQRLLKRGHEVVIIERDKSRIEALADELDCGFLHGDGSKPAVLREADPEHTDVLYCLTGDDESNIIASLVGRSLGFERVVTKIDDVEFEHICVELGLEDTINPARTIARHLADVLEGQDPFELSSMLRDDAHAASFAATSEDAGAMKDLKLPGDTRVICLYRDNKLIVPEDETKIKADDEVVVITRREHVGEIAERGSKP
jgi:trk system potassium uptake protein TrkA